MYCCCTSQLKQNTKCPGSFIKYTSSILCLFLHFLWAVTALNWHFARISGLPSPRSVNFAPIGVFLNLQCEYTLLQIEAHSLLFVINYMGLPFFIQPPNYSIWILTHLKLCLADAIHNFKWVKIIHIWQNGGQLFSNLTDWCHVYFQHVQKLIGNVLIKNVKNEYNRYRRLKG